MIKVVYERVISSESGASGPRFTLFLSCQERKQPRSQGPVFRSQGPLSKNEVGRRAQACEQLVMGQ